MTVRRQPSNTTRFDRLVTEAMFCLHPEGQPHARHRPSGRSGYHRAVIPDFVLPDGRWIEFKYRMSLRDRRDVPWRPQTFYASLRKYLDHAANPTKSLIFVYGHLHGRVEDVDFPVCRGRTVLLRDATEFAQKVQLVDVRRLFDRVERRGGAEAVSELSSLLTASGRSRVRAT